MVFLHVMSPRRRRTHQTERRHHARDQRIRQRTEKSSSVTYHSKANHASRSNANLVNLGPVAQILLQKACLQHGSVADKYISTKASIPSLTFLDEEDNDSSTVLASNRRYNSWDPSNRHDNLESPWARDQDRTLGSAMRRMRTGCKERGNTDLRLVGDMVKLDRSVSRIRRKTRQNTIKNEVGMQLLLVLFITLWGSWLMISSTWHESNVTKQCILLHHSICTIKKPHPRFYSHGMASMRHLTLRSRRHSFRAS